MKSFFKKVALLLVLAMVVTMLPAKAASAALDDDGLYMRSKLTLYLGGDASGDIDDFGYASVKYDKDIYTGVSFVSSNPEVAEVGSKKGGVTALAVGKATVTATFTAADGTTKTRDCEVSVKQNAKEVWVSAKNEAALLTLTAGDELQLVVGRTAKDGTVAWNQKGAITDGIRFASSDESVFTVGPKKGGVKAVGEGEAILYVWAVEGQKQNGGVDPADPVDPENPEALVENLGNPYIETCKDGKIEEDDPYYDYYKYLRTTPVMVYKVVVAGKIVEVNQTTVDTFEITCSDEKVASKLTVDNLSVAYVANGIDIQTYVKSVAVKDGDKNKNIAVVTMHNPIDPGVTYKVTYGDTTLEFVGATQEPHHIAINTLEAEAGKDVEIKVLVYNEDGVDITTTDLLSNVTISAPENPDYSVLGSARTIYFFEAGKKAEVTATYDMGYDVEGKELDDLTDTVVIESYVVTDGPISGWLVTNDAGKATKAENFGSTVATLAAGDSGFVLYGMYKRSDDSVRYTKNALDDGVAFTYESTNESILMVDPTDGTLYPIAAGTATVIVKVNNAVVGVCSIPIVASRDFDSLTVKADKALLSKNSDDPDQVKVTLTVKDQLGADISSFDVVATQVGTNDEIAVATWKDGNEVIITPGKDAGTTARTVNIRIEVTVGNVTKSQNVRVSVKDVSGAAAHSYKVNVKDSIDLKLEDGKYGKGDYDTTITVDYFDVDGYYLGTKTEDNGLVSVASADEASTDNGEYSFIVTRNNKAVTVSGTTLQTVVLSGSSELVKQDTGTYSVRVYKGNGSKAQLVGSATITVKDSTTTMTVVQDKQEADDIMGSLTFKRGNDTVDKAKLSCPDPLADAVKTASGTFVRTLTIYEQIDNYYHVIKVQVNKFFK